MFTFQPQPVYQRLESILKLATEIRTLSDMIPSEPPGEWQLMNRFARERAVWLAIEAVTDVGTMILDGLILRDAGSYEEIIHILHLENALDDVLAESWKRWVRERHALVGTSFQKETAASDWDGRFGELPVLLMDYHVAIHQFLKKELEMSTS